MRRLNQKANQMLIAGYVKGIHAKEKVFEILKQEQGEGFVDTARASVTTAQSCYERGRLENLLWQSRD